MSRIQVHGKGQKNYNVQPRLVGRGVGSVGVWGRSNLPQKKFNQEPNFGGGGGCGGGWVIINLPKKNLNQEPNFPPPPPALKSKIPRSAPAVYIFHTSFPPFRRHFEKWITHREQLRTLEPENKVSTWLAEKRESVNTWRCLRNLQWHGRRLNAGHSRLAIASH